MPKFPTRSWRAREALADRMPYTTHGAMYASVEAHSLPWGHRLPKPWAERYERERERMTYVVWSYSTPIAWVLDNGTVVKVDHKWSIATTKHQGLLYALDAAETTREAIRISAARERTPVGEMLDREPPVRLTSADAMRSQPEDCDTLICEVEGMLVR